MQKVIVFVVSCFLAISSAQAARNVATQDFNAAFTPRAAAGTQAGGDRFALINAKVHAALLENKNLKTHAPRSTFDTRLGTSTFLWAPPSLTHGANPTKAMAFSPIRSELRAEAAARDYLSRQASYLRLDRDTVAGAVMFDKHDQGTGPVIARFKQYKDGIEVFGRSLNVMMDQSMNPIATSGYFAPAAAGKAQTKAAKQGAPEFSMAADGAITRAFGDMGGHAEPALRFARQAGDYQVYEPGAKKGDYHLTGTPAAKKVYFYVDGSYVPAWYVNVQAGTIDGATNDYMGYVVSAVDGKVLFRKNLTANDAYTYRVFADATIPFRPQDEPIGNNTLDPFTAGPTGDQGRVQGTSNLNTLNNSGLIATSFAANDSWLPPGTIVTSGNNVNAYLNLGGGDGFQAGDIRGAANGPNTFDYSYTVDTDPTTPSQRQAAVVNQFYLNNFMHDSWYDRGFNEASGNAQVSNFSRGGFDGDPILGQAQDFSKRNNADMSTPPDGFSPIQRMYLFDGPLLATSTLTVNTPATGAIAFGTASFGPRSFDVTADALRIRDDADLTNGCNAASTANAAAMAGKIAIIDRGVCTFKNKALNAQNAGAVGVIIVNNRVAADPPGLGDDNTIATTITAATMSVKQDDGQALEAVLDAGNPVNLHMALFFAADRDGTMDTQIMAHEFFHYVSNRLVGDALGLTGQQGGGMGEGWSDFNAMLLTVRVEDKLVGGNNLYQGAYPLSEYVSFDQYFGIRRYPYSTDMTVDPLTFQHIEEGAPLPAGVPVAGFAALNGAGNPEVHNVGEVWCTVLWDIYASILNDPRYSAGAARRRMQDYIIAGLKMTPNVPTMLEARDALLAAARATDATDFANMATAFAKRGMGVDATGPDRADPFNSGVLESSLAIAAGIQVVDATLAFTGIPAGTLGDLDADGVLDRGETARLTFTVVNNGTSDMAAPLNGLIEPVAGITLGNGGAVTVPALAIGETAPLSVLVTLNTATQAQDETFVLSFPAANNPQTGGITAGGTAALGGQFDTVVNYDETKLVNTDDVEDTLATQHDWTLSNNGTSGPGWSVLDGPSVFGADVFGTGQFWFGPDNDAPTDITLESPTIAVGTVAPLTLAFDHFFAFEFAGFDGAGTAYGFDGGVIEVSTDGGATWLDAFDPAIGGSVTTGNGYNGLLLSLDPDGTFDPAENIGLHEGFVDTNNDPPALESLVIDFGNTLAGQNVKVRFREVSDLNTAVFGWIVDNIAVTGSTTPVFSQTVADGAKAITVPVANAGPDQTGHTGQAVNLNGTASTVYQGATIFHWSQTAGPGITLVDPFLGTPHFTPTAPGTYTWALSVTDNVGRTSAVDTMNVVVAGAAVGGGGSGGGGGGAFGLGFSLLGLGAAALRRRRRRN